MTIYLYVKTHNKTGLKYLGKTIQNPYEYKGSGTIWRRHIKKHGYDVTTKILYQTECKDEFCKVAKEYSKKFNIVESKEWANIVPEQGDGGDTSHSENWKKAMANKESTKGKTYEEIYGFDTAQKLKESRSLSNKQRGPWSNESRKKLSNSCKGRVPWNKNKKIVNQEHLDKIAKIREDFIKSGLSRKEYATLHNINYTTFKKYVRGL